MSQHSDEGADFKKDVVGIFDVIVHPQYNRAFIAVVTVMLGQQLCGQYYFDPYSQILHKMSFFYPKNHHFKSIHPSC